MDKETEKIQKELDAIMFKDGILKEGDTRWSPFFWHRIWLGFFGLIGIALAMKLISYMGL